MTNAECKMKSDTEFFDAKRLLYSTFCLLTSSLKRGLNTKIHLAVDANGMPLRVLVTAGITADCRKAVELIDGYDEDYLLADRGYDTDTIIETVQAANMKPVILPKKNRKVQRYYDKDLYRVRHLVENAFLHLKRWCGICTCYAKATGSFIAAVQIQCIALYSLNYCRHNLGNH